MNDRERIIEMEKRRAELNGRVTEYVKQLFLMRETLGLSLIFDEGELRLHDLKSEGLMFTKTKDREMPVTVISGFDEIYFKVPFSETRDKAKEEIQ